MACFAFPAGEFPCAEVSHLLIAPFGAVMTSNFAWGLFSSELANLSGPKLAFQDFGMTELLKSGPSGALTLKLTDKSIFGVTPEPPEMVVNARPVFL